MNVNCSLGDHNYLAEVKADDHLIKVDEPIKMGGADRHPNPIQYFLASLASCTAITIKMYAQNKGWETGNINVSVKMKDVLSEDKLYKKITKTVQFEKSLDNEQKKRLLHIGEKCPISKLLAHPVIIEIVSLE